MLSLWKNHTTEDLMHKPVPKFPEDTKLRKPRRDKRRTPKIDLRALDVETIPLQPENHHYAYERARTGRQRQVGRERCIEEGKHNLGRWKSIWGGYAVYCLRCGEFGGFTER